MEVRPLIGVVEAAYHLEGSEEDWLRGIMKAMPGSFDRGFGIAAYTYQLSRGHPAQLGAVVASGPPWLAEVTLAVNSPKSNARADRKALLEAQRRTIAGAPCFGTASEIFGRSSELYAAAFERDPFAQRYGYRDFVGIIAREPSGFGVTLGGLLPAPERSARRDRARYSRIAAHLSAALRLRRTLSTGRGAEEAVLSATGACLDAGPSAQAPTVRERLRQAARAIDRARSELRTDDDEALALWEALCAGQWSLVDRFESDGRRFLIAHRNAPDIAEPRALTARERQVLGYAVLGCSNKLIAYSLGLATSTVALHLSSAIQKLGFTSRVALVEAASHLLAGRRS